MNSLTQIIAMELLDFTLCALVLVVVMKNRRLRNRAARGLDIALTYLSGYFRPQVTVNVPEPDYQRQERVMIAAALASNPRNIYRDDNYDMSEIIRKIVKGIDPPEPATLHAFADLDFQDGDGPNYEADEEELDEEDDQIGESGGIL